MSGTSQRVASIRSRLAAEAMDALVVRDVANVSYLSAFDDVWDEEPAALLLVTATLATVFTDSRYEVAATQAALETCWEVSVIAGDLWDALIERAGADGVRRLAVEASLPFSVVERVRDSFAGEVMPVSGWVEGLRVAKDADEIARIKAAQAITDAAFDHILGYVTRGMTETAIALELEFHMRSHGSSGVAFSPIVASGPNSALPHAHPGARRVATGDFLKMDFGARVGGYCSDMTRTVVVGKASDRQRAIYDAVLAANEAGIEAVRPGLIGREIDAAARAVLSQRGYGELFTHGLGHGVGIEVHELPGVGSRSDGVVGEGSVITIEPGVYVPGFGGVRIEDLVVVEAAGARVLTRSTKELIEL